MEIKDLINLKSLEDSCKISSCRIITREDTGEVVKIMCEFIPNDSEKGTSKQPLFRSTTTNR